MESIAISATCAEHCTDADYSIYISLLSRRHSIWPIPRPRELRRPVLIPRKLLRADRPRAPPIRRIPHAMINNPVLLPIRALREARMPHTVRVLQRVLVEDAAVVVLAPVLHVHGILADELQLAEAVVAVIGTRGGVDDELLARVRVRELLGPFVGGEAVVDGAAVGRLLPCVFRDAEDHALGKVGGHSPGVGHLSDAQIRGPTVVLPVPAAVDVVQAGGVLEVRPIDGKLVVRV